MKNRKIVVAGAGIVGSVQALLLARAGFSVVLVEARQPAPEQTGLNVRSVALSCRSYELLQSQGLWPAQSGCAIRSVQATERGRFGSVHLTSDDLDVDSLGYVLANAPLENFLISQVNAEPEIEFIRPAVVRVVSNSSAGVVVEVGAQTINAGLLIAADGTNSGVRESIGVGIRQRDYEQHAIVANLLCQRHHQNIAHERFTDTGPLALLPLADRQVAMVYTVNSDTVDQLMSKSDDDFLALVQRRFGGKLGRFQALGKRMYFPLHLLETEQQCAGSCVFIGNSARTLHPVAGQGLNLALRDVFALTAGVCSAANYQQATTEFVRLRQSDQRLVTGQTDLLARFFTKRQWPLQIPLSLFGMTAMLLLDNVPALRSKFGALSAGVGVPLRSASSSALTSPLTPDKRA